MQVLGMTAGVNVLIVLTKADLEDPYFTEKLYL